MDTLHDTNLRVQQPKKEEVSTSPVPFPKQAGGRLKPFSHTRVEPSFKSFLVGSSSSAGSADQEVVETAPPSQQQLTASQSYVPKS